MAETIISHEFVDNWNMGVDVVRDVGEVRGVHVEVWRSKASGKIALTVSPTVQGFTVLAVGDVGELDVFTNVGRAVLQAMAGVLPLVVGDLFRAPAGQGGMPAVVRQ